MPEEKKKVSKAQQKAVQKYVRNNYDRLNIMVPKGEKENIQKAAAAVNESLNQYVGGAIKRRMESGE